MYTGRYGECVYTELYSRARVPSSETTCQYKICVLYTGRFKGYTECGVEAMCTDFLYLVNNNLCFLAGKQFVYEGF